MIKKSFILTERENRWLRTKAYIMRKPETVIIRAILDEEIARDESKKKGGKKR